MTDPWLIQNNTKSEGSQKNEQPAESEKEQLQFEDNFAQSSAQSSQGATCHQPLPDSETYLQGLERKLQKLKKSTKLVEALAEKRQDCLRSFIEADSTITSSDNQSNNNDEILALDTPITNGDSTVQDIYRLLQPIQAVTVGETVHIVHFDHLDQQRREAEEEDDETPASR